MLFNFVFHFVPIFSSFSFLGLLKINDHFQSTGGSGSETHLMSGLNSNASTIKIRNLAHLLQQLDELGQPISANNSEDVRISETETDRHLYAGDGSHHGSGSGRSQQSSIVVGQSSIVVGQSSRGVSAVSSGSGRHPITPTLSLDSQLVEQDLAYLLGTNNEPEQPDLRRPQSRPPTMATSIGSNSNIRLPQGTMQRFKFFFSLFSLFLPFYKPNSFFFHSGIYTLVRWEI